VRVAYVTTDLERVGHEDVDRPFHERAAPGAGLALEHPHWGDPRVDWAAYDLLVLRSPWDYSTRRHDFLAWLDRVETLAPLHNPPAVVRWNLDKHYLADLATAGVPVIPTVFADSEAQVAAALRRHEADAVVVKPSVSAGSRNTGRFAAQAPGARTLARTILAEGLAVMIQPFARSVDEEGETSLVHFDGAFGHAFRKGAMLAQGGGLRGTGYRENISPASPTAAQRDVARSAELAVRRLCRERFDISDPLLYARFDLVTLDDGSAALLEAELFEPCFFLQVAPDSAQLLADAVRRRGSRGISGQ
jgi:glutathione synthase/RimK-type ligase-like ATP-grasp enzyme